MQVHKEQHKYTGVTLLEPGSHCYCLLPGLYHDCVEYSELRTGVTLQWTLQCQCTAGLVTVGGNALLSEVPMTSRFLLVRRSSQLCREFFIMEDLGLVTPS